MTIPNGTWLGPYEVLCTIGAGAMGEVYQAHDAKLRRDVAIKVLPKEFIHDPERLTRFQREARVLASLNHPNIATIHGLDHSDGVHYLVMELVPGETLAERVSKGPLPPEESLRVASQIAEALEAAHEKGVIHRDLKPANVKVTPQGRVKVLDFGLAKAFAGNSQQDLSQAPTLTALGTEDGRILGTPSYMSPEQARGLPVDKRTDIWAFGCVLYEMLTSRQAFPGATLSDSIAAILKHEPDWQALPSSTMPRICDLLRRCLQKDSQRRLRDLGDARIEIEEVLAARAIPAQPVSSPRAARPKATFLMVGAVGGLILLAAIGVIMWRAKFGSAGQPQIRSIAVLPLQNFSNDPNQEYFADGTTEALISDLAQIRSLQVISRTSVMRYKGTTEPLTQIGKELGADLIVEGSVQRSEGRVRIVAQLIRASTDTHLWAKNYDRDLSDALKLEADVAQEIAREIQVQVTPEEASYLARARSVMPEAREEFLLGSFYLDKGNPADAMEAIKHLDRAIELDPAYAEAYAALAGGWESLGGPEAISRARTASQKALELDANLAEAHVAEAGVKTADWDWAGADQEYRKALSLNPDSIDSCACYATFLSQIGRLPEALALAQHGMQVNPLSAFVQYSYGLALYDSRKYDEATARLQRAIELAPGDRQAYRLLARVYGMTGRSQEAIGLLDRPEFKSSPELALAYAFAGRRTEALKIAQDLTKTGSRPEARRIAMIYFALGEKDQGFLWTTRAVDARDPLLATFKTDPLLDGVRSDPRYRALMARLNLPD